MKEKIKLSVYDIARMGVMVAALEGGKIALSFLPNVEIITLLIILYTLCFGRKVFYAIFAFVLLEGFLYGFGMWFAAYLYIWPLLALVTYLCRNNTGVIFWSVISGLFGLFFGALCALPYVFVSGIQGAFAWWAAGILFDIIHCVSNFTLTMILFKPLNNVLRRLNG